MSTISAGVLTWQSPQTLERTLQSYEQHGLSNFVDQRVVYVQELGSAECEIAERFGWDVIGTPENIGIAHAYRALLRATSSPHFLFLECDWKLTSNPEDQLKASASLLQEREVSVVRLRSLSKPGFPLGALRIQNREHRHPEWLIEVSYYEPRPWEVFPGQLGVRSVGGFTFTTASTTYAGWSNNPHLVRRDVVERLMMKGPGPQGNVESEVGDSWKEERGLVAHGPGLFTHIREDGSALNHKDLMQRLQQRWLWNTRGLRRRLRSGQYLPDARDCLHEGRSSALSNDVLDSA